MAAMSIPVLVAIVDSCHHLSHLGGNVGVTINATCIINTGTYCSCHTIHGSSVAIGHDDVEDSACALGIIFCAWVGNNLYLFNHRRGNHLEDFLHVHAGQCGIGMTIAVNLE